MEVSLKQEENAVTVSFDYRFSIHEGLSVQTAYTVYSDGAVRVRTRYNGAAGLPDLPIVALSFKMSADYSQSEWYAMGPEENYIDRAFGARLGVFNRKVQDLPSRYLVPQESGNRTGVRRLKITDEHGVGLQISAPAAAPVECNLSPYTAFELEHAGHGFELPQVHYTVVTIAGRQMGVGGDDSWGAPVHKEYTIPAEQNLEYEFILSSVGITDN
ncbi:Beta-galactosidase [compost metagenome]